MTSNKKIIISDAGPLIAMGRIKHISLLSETLGDIIIPQAVADECLHDLSKPGANEIQHAIQKCRIYVHKNPPTHTYQKWSDLLGPGESAAITLAVKLNAGLFIDEKLGRQVAINMNLRIIGTAGLLLLAKHNGIIPNVRPILTALKQASYYLSAALEKEVLLQANELRKTT